MDIYITLDYELFFGSESGSAEHCIIRPTEALLEIAEHYGIKLNCFVDTGYLLALEKQKGAYTQLKKDLEQVSGQISYLSEKGHGMELHIHPHWEDSYFNGQRWVFDTGRYKLADFSDEDVREIVSRHTAILTKISGRSPVAYRAGGWSAQPFRPIGDALAENGIFIDSTVYPGGYYESSHQTFDFRAVPPFKTHYRFSDDLVAEDPEGLFTEFPIAAHRVSPAFFWRFAWEKLRKAQKHRAFGDGKAISLSKEGIFEKLTRSSVSVASIDGFKSRYLSATFGKYQRHNNNQGNFVIIGHPKAFTPYSLRKVQDFISQTCGTNNYRTFR